jgi:hypothetical protein
MNIMKLNDKYEDREKGVKQCEKCGHKDCENIYII